MKGSKTNIVKMACCFAAVICCAAIVGCDRVDKYDKMYVKDSDGNIYQLEWRIGGVYFVNKEKLPKEWK